MPCNDALTLLNELALESVIGPQQDLNVVEISL